MTVTPLLIGKLLLGLLLVVAIGIAARGRAPRRAPAPAELRRLVASALVLYAVGLIALIDGHPTLSTIAFACGVGTASLAAWLSRGADSDDDGPSGGHEPPEGVPPPDPEGLSAWDWERFDRERHDWEQRRPATPH
jgi:hypothetical protein